MLISEMSHTPAFVHCLNSREELTQISVLDIFFLIKPGTFIFGVLSEFVTAEKLVFISEFLILYCELLLMEERKKIPQEEIAVSSVASAIAYRSGKTTFQVSRFFWVLK